MHTPESSVSFPALGSVAVILVSEPSRLQRAREAVQRTVAEFDLACSRFREDSELSAVNAAAGEVVPVGPVLRDAVLEALRGARLTDGDVDPTVGRSLVALGYDRDFDELATPEARAREITIVPVPGWRTVEVDARASTVRVPRGVMLDLGATAKALAADRAAAAAHELAGCGVLVSLGGDISIAGPAPQEGWRVRVTDDHRAGVEAPGQWITLRSGGLATSSTTVRRWHTAGRTAHHLVNPANGRPLATAWRTVSVCAANCLDANIATTAAMVRGERAVAWLESLGLPSRLVGVDASVRHLAAWPSGGDDLAAVTEPTPVFAGGSPR
jgi:FAD:protein FMN transferase